MTIHQHERGFTLIELLVVMIIISILMAVAVPVFLGQKQKAAASNAKSLIKSAQDTMESCAASTGIGAFTDESGNLICDDRYVRTDEPALQAKACHATNNFPPALNTHTSLPAGSRIAECFHLANGTGVDANDSYLIVAKTANLSGNRFGWFALNRNSDGIQKRCGYSLGAPAWPTVVDPTGGASWPAATPPTNPDGRRICATGQW